jgi:hypothetical protein
MDLQRSSIRHQNSKIIAASLCVPHSRDGDPLEGDAAAADSAADLTSTFEGDDARTTDDSACDGASSSNETSCTGSRSAMKPHEKTKGQANDGQLAGNETKAVRRLKCIVFSCLFLSMMVVAFLAYFLTAQQETEQFEAQYYEDANKVLSTMGSNLKRTLQASDAFVTSMTSAAEDTNQTWPYVVIPNFAVQAEKIRTLANAVCIYTYNLVPPGQRGRWENFTAHTGKAWMNESIRAIEDYEGMDWEIIWNYTTYDVIWDFGEYDKENPGEEGVTYDGPWLPNWQAHPVIPTSPFYNWYGHSTIPPPSHVDVVTLLPTSVR